MFVIDATTLPIILLVLTTVFSSIGFLFKWRVGLIKPLDEKEEVQEENEVQERRKIPRLEYHPVFAELTELEKYFMTRYRHPDLGRQQLAIEMIVHNVRIWRKILTEFAEDIGECTSTCGLSHPECNKVFNLAMEGYIKGLEECSTWYKLDTAQNIYGDKLYTKVDKETITIYGEAFNVFNKLNEAMLHMIIKDVSNSHLYDDCTQKAYIILHGYYLVFNLIRMSADGALKTLNGSLSGKKFLGITIGEE